MMKLRLRLHGARETLKVELPDTCTLQDLQQWISVSSPASIHLSLNRKDELHASSPDETLQSLGVTSGDLVYYSLDPSAFQPPSQTAGSASPSVVQQTQAQERQALDGNLDGQGTLVQEPHPNRALESSSQGSRSIDFDVVPENPNSNTNYRNQQDPHHHLSAKERTEDSKEAISGMEEKEASIQEDTEAMDIEYSDVEITGGKRLSEPYFLKNVLMDESGDTSELTLLVMAVHAVMLESGFVRVDNFSGARTDKFSFSKEGFSASLQYTLPELISTGNDARMSESVCLKFQSLGHLVNVYGSLGKGGSVNRVSLNKRRFVPAIDMVMENLKSGNEGSSSTYNEVFAFWKMVKDGLALPLLIDLCDNAGLSLPPCLIRLPTELKLKILESLPGVDIARTACVCSEMRYLSSNNDLWKQKYDEEFGSEGTEVKGVLSFNWKEKFAAYWVSRRHIDKAIVPRFVLPHPNSFGFPRIWRDPRPVRFPPLMLGDNDRLPGGVPSPFRRRRQGFLRQNFSPNCNLGGFNA